MYKRDTLMYYTYRKIIKISSKIFRASAIAAETVLIILIFYFKAYLDSRQLDPLIIHRIPPLPQKTYRFKLLNASPCSYLLYLTFRGDAPLCITWIFSKSRIISPDSNRGLFIRRKRKWRDLFSHDLSQFRLRTENQLLIICITLH